jgi:molecular chaperone GrpE
VDNKQEEERAHPVEDGSQDEPAEAEVEAGEDFDPETADREALLVKYKKLEDQLAGAEERVLRIGAESENFKKRLQREKEEQTRYANEALMRDLLSVIDNLERALDHSRAEAEQGGLVEGLNMTLKGFSDTLSRFACSPVEAMGKPFDPNFHEAVSQEETAEHKENTVVRELQKGYMLKDRLLRPAMVVVSKPPSRETEAAQRQGRNEGAKAGEREVKG